MRIILNKWFLSNGGTEISPLEKPLDTAAHKRSSLRWVRKYLFILASSHVYVAFLDEQFFCTTSRRNYLKNLPEAAREEEGCGRRIPPKIISHRFLIKCMFLGVVGINFLLRNICQNNLLFLALYSPLDFR